jgi:Uri superfamily endonuclease
MSFLSTVAVFRREQERSARDETMPSWHIDYCSLRTVREVLVNCQRETCHAAESR